MASHLGALQAPSGITDTKGDVMESLDQLRRVLERLLEIFTVCLLLALTLTVLSAVALRTFGGSLPWYDEVASINLAWLSFYGACLATLKRAHMGFPGIVAKSPPRIRAALFVFSEAIVIGFFSVVAWYGHSVLEVLAWDSMVALPSIGLHITQSVIPISAVLFIFCELLSMSVAWRKMRAGIDSEEEAIEEAIRTAEDDLKEHRS